MLKKKPYHKIKDNRRVVVYRNNPDYPAGHCFTLVKCKDCGEYYEADCEAKHICEKQNSYPMDESEVLEYD